MVGVFGVPFDVSSPSKLGSRFGPKAYRETSTYFRPHTTPGGSVIEIDTRERVDADTVRQKVRDLGDLPVSHVDWSKTEGLLRDTVNQIMSRGAIPIALGGDHFITYPMVQGFSDAVSKRNGGRIGYIQFSSRLDLGTDDPAWGKVWRGATARRIIDAGTVRAENMVWVGVNGYVPLEDWELAQQLPGKVFTAKDVREHGIAEITARALELAGKDCNGVYLSVDMDVVDGGYVAMTGAPRFDGLKNLDLWKAIEILGRDKIGAMDICGLNPLIEVMSLGKTGQRFGADLVLRFILAKIREARLP